MASRRTRRSRSPTRIRDRGPWPEEVGPPEQVRSDVPALHVSAVRIVGRVDHRSIVEVRWVNDITSETGTWSREQMVDYLSGPDPGRAIVTDDLGPVDVRVVAGEPSYLQTFDGERPTSNLLWLPKF